MLLTKLNPPQGYTLVGEGIGAAAGFAMGGADAKLTEDGKNTLLEYGVQPSVGGKVTQIGGWLIESTTRKLAADFFKKFSVILQEAT